MTDLDNIIRSKIDDDREEAWKPDHKNAMQCRNLEDLIREGMRHFRRIRDNDDAWSRRVCFGEIKFDAEIARALRERYEWWYAPCDDVLACVEVFERKFGIVEGADEFRRARSTVRNILTTSIADVIRSMEQNSPEAFEDLPE